MTEFIWGVRVWLAKEFTRSEKNWKKIFFLFTLLEWTRQSPWKQKQNKIFQSCKKLKHFIYFETWNLFWEIVFILRRIYFKTLYLFRDIVFNSSPCICSKKLNILIATRPRDHWVTLLNSRKTSSVRLCTEVATPWRSRQARRRRRSKSRTAETTNKCTKGLFL